MTSQSLLSGYSLVTTTILIFLSVQNRRYRKWYRQLLIHPDAPLRIQRFFIEMESEFKRFYPLLDRLKSQLGRPITDLYFQDRWLVWWKFFGPKKLQPAIRMFNHSKSLKKILDAPAKPYSRDIFRGFRQKLGAGMLEHLQGLLIEQFERQGLLSGLVLLVDSFPVKSFLNTIKCLKIPPINYEHLAQFLKTVSVQAALTRLQIPPHYWKNVHTKLLAL